MVDFGNALKTLRLREDMTQAQLAQKLSLTKSVISAYETGLRLPSYDVLIQMLRFSMLLPIIYWDWKENMSLTCPDLHRQK